MKRWKKYASIALGFSLLVLAFFAVRYFALTAGARVSALESEIARLKETVTPVRFKVTARTASSVSTELRFYDLSGAEVGKRALTVSGKELTIDVSVVRAGENAWVFFPFAVFSDEVAAIDGFSLTGAYDKAGFPAIYGDKSKKRAASERFRTGLTELFARVKADGSVSSGDWSDSFGAAVHDIKELSGFKVGAVYAVLCHPHTGGVEIVAE